MLHMMIVDNVRAPCAWQGAGGSSSLPACQPACLPLASACLPSLADCLPPSSALPHPLLPCLQLIHADLHPGNILGKYLEFILGILNV